MANPSTMEMLILSSAVGFAVGFYLYIRRPDFLYKRKQQPRSPAEEVAARLRAVVPDELIELIEVNLEDERNPIALQLSRDPTPEEQEKINRACNRAIRDLVEDLGPPPVVVPDDEEAAGPESQSVAAEPQSN